MLRLHAGGYMKKGWFRTIADLNLPATLVVKCPLLTHVKLIQRIGGTDQSQTISSFVRGLELIQSLEVEDLGPTAFQHLAHLPDLQILRLGSPQIPHANFISARFAARGIQCGYNPSVRPVVDDTNLRRSEKHLPRAPLANLRITSARRNARQTLPIEPPSIKIETIRCLFQFTNITSLALWPPIGIDVDDDAVQTIAETFPLLQKLSLSSRAKVHPLRPTPRSLVSLAQCCPFLERLEMGVNASKIPKVDYRSRRRVLQQYQLVVWEDKRVYDEGVGDVLRKPWREVEDAFLICRDMREEERAGLLKAVHNIAGAVEIRNWSC
ncbi:hypothetical protein B0H19DRAFT_1055247 [Mycena capillaripes]|nr:hypothetical protein B0H19DRAFT_1055247 [Mycena capillaripes]